MKRGSTIFLRIVLILLAVVVLAGLIRFPLSEGRAVNLDLFSIYADPFIIYLYLATIPFFAALYQSFKLLGYIGENKVFSLNSVKCLRAIKYCGIILAIAIIAAVVYIRLFHAKDDDPAGFVVIGFVAAFLSVVVATAAALFAKLLQSAVEIKSENDLTV